MRLQEVLKWVNKPVHIKFSEHGEPDITGYIVAKTKEPEIIIVMQNDDLPPGWDRIEGKIDWIYTHIEYIEEIYDSPVDFTLQEARQVVLDDMEPYEHPLEIEFFEESL